VEFCGKDERQVDSFSFPAAKSVWIMNEQQIKNPLHGMTLEQIVTSLVDDYGWQKLGKYIDIRCFTCDPSIASSLKFLRRTPWARRKVEDLYIATRKRAARKR
jgi:uncharacterized protein (DUF2132 family)